MRLELTSYDAASDSPPLRTALAEITLHSLRNIQLDIPLPSRLQSTHTHSDPLPQDPCARATPIPRDKRSEGRRLRNNLGERRISVELVRRSCWGRRRVADQYSTYQCVLLPSSAFLRCVLSRSPQRRRRRIFNFQSMDYASTPLEDRLGKCMRLILYLGG